MRVPFSIITLAFVAACSGGAEARRPATLLFLTDFGRIDGAVAVCKGVMWGIQRDLRIVDITHAIPPYDIEIAGEVLEQTMPFYPPGTVVVAVVDPGVGSARKSIAIRTKKGHLLVGPDNGLFTLVLEAEGLDRAVELTNKAYLREGEAAYTFHGRDIFSPVGAHLARGVSIDALGPAVTPVRLDMKRAHRAGESVEGTVRYVEDPFGNVVTNIPPSLLDSAGMRVGDSVEVRIGTRVLRLPWRNTFSDVPRGDALAVMHERALLSFSINQGDFAAKFGVKRRDAVFVRRLPRGRG